MSKPTRIVSLLARRFTLSKHTDRFVALITWVSIAGIVLGVVSLTVVNSVINGFRGELKRAITSLQGDAVVYTRGNPISYPEQVVAKIRELAPEVQGVTYSFLTELMVGGKPRSSGDSAPPAVSGAVLEGLELESARKTLSLEKRIIDGALPTAKNEFVLGKSLAERIGVQTGDEIRLILPFQGVKQSSGETELSPVPKVVQAKVSGIVQIGLHDYDSKFIFGSIESVQEIVGEPNRATNFKIKLPDHVDPLETSRKLNEFFATPYRVRVWGELYKNLFYAIQLEKVVISICLMAIIIVAAFNVVSTLMMMIHDKTKEIAILKAMGLRDRQGFRLFCLIGTAIGSVGALLGVGFGLAIAKVLQTTQFIQIPASVYAIGFLPVFIRWEEVITIAVATIAIALGASLYPAWKVSKQSPLQGIRYD